MKISRIYNKTYPPYLYLKMDSGKEFRIWAHHKTNYSIIERNKYKFATSQKKLLRQIIAIIEKHSSKEEKTKPVISRITAKISELGADGQRLRQRTLNWRDYDLWKEINNHEWLKAGQPSMRALDWYNRVARKDADFQFKSKLLRQGFLYIFHYDTPKYGDVLDFFDTEPLVISFGEIETNEGKRDIGINLHLLPRKIRAIVMYKIFELNRNYFKEEVFEKPQKPIPITWKQLKKPLEKYGIAFAIRMYIPELRKQTIEFPFENWKDAIYIESKGYSKKSIEEIESLWQKFVHKSNLKLSESWQRS